MVSGLSHGIRAGIAQPRTGKGRAEWALVITAGSVRRPTYSTRLEWTPGLRCTLSRFQTLERGSEFSLGYLITLDMSATVSGWYYVIQTWSWRTIPNVGTSNWASQPQGSSTTGTMPNTPFVPDARLAASNFCLRCNRTILILSYHLLASNPPEHCLATLGQGLREQHFCSARWIPARLRQQGP